MHCMYMRYGAVYVHVRVHITIHLFQLPAHLASVRLVMRSVEQTT